MPTNSCSTTSPCPAPWRGACFPRRPGPAALIVIVLAVLVMAAVDEPAAAAAAGCLQAIGALLVAWPTRARLTDLLRP